MEQFEALASASRRRRRTYELCQLHMTDPTQPEPELTWTERRAERKRLRAVRRERRREAMRRANQRKKSAKGKDRKKDKKG